MPNTLIFGPGFKNALGFGLFPLKSFAFNQNQSLLNPSLGDVLFPPALLLCLLSAATALPQRTLAFFFVRKSPHRDDFWLVFFPPLLTVQESNTFRAVVLFARPQCSQVPVASEGQHWLVNTFLSCFGVIFLVI